MLKKRLIPVIFLMNGKIVRAEQFKRFKIIGNPVSQLARLMDWSPDEILYIDITRNGKIEDVFPLMHDIADAIFSNRNGASPLTFGGHIQSVDHVRKLFELGADKILVNTYARELTNIIAKHYGNQAIVCGIDYLDNGVYIKHGTEKVFGSVVDYAKELSDLGAGEIMLNSIERDGMSCGYDLDMAEKISSVVSCPVIICGGAGSYVDFQKALDTKVSAVAAGNIFNFKENAYKNAKKMLKENGCNVRCPY